MIRDKLADAKKRLDEWDEKRRERWQNKVEETGDRWKERLEEKAAVDRDISQVESIIEQAQGESIRPNNLFRMLNNDETVPYDLLDENEQPHYFLRGSSIDVEGDGAGGESITGWDRDRRIGSAFTVLTEQRVLVIADHFRGYDQHTIPYGSITSINLNTGLVSTRLTLQTRGATYHLSVTTSDDDEVEQAVEYLRERRREEDKPGVDSDDPLDRLEKLKSLHNDGVLTDEEFEDKKAELLDDI
ncbi:hypothetical protein EXE46_08030 [Halorubrum sp. GN11_10-6_MGM]|uniref:PH domain-containing protein n=1 Tax=Halorubrum sp. GN11_10-6_MGM TaxID=2518112 RepID=UPI0010F89C80|nr:PH domain-containing protein [Halorubrum sp. GN11_10-6_MGM]TKX74674.1 hypothetical protein EXE46_08030 [Halorubrum sp. GN11_10-6_MGM]